MINVTAKKLTVVYTITDKLAFAEERDRISRSLMRPPDIDSAIGFGVTAISNEDEVCRLELIEEAVSRKNWTILDEILSAVSVHRYKDLDAFLSSLEETDF